VSTVRQKTRVIVRVDSHNRGPGSSAGQVVDLSADCVSFSTSKNTKSMGRWQLQLVPRRNYSNLIFPNDVVNIYVDPGDGTRGFVRLMMGYIDRIEMQESVDDNGAVTTRYTIIGSDFQKAIEKTFIYFNGFMKQLLDERFVRTATGPGRPTLANIAGITLRNAGLNMFGSPADFVENMLRVLLGFNQQWVLPDSYGRVRSNLKQIRSKNVQQAKARFPTAIKDAIKALGYDADAIESNVDSIITTAAQVLSETDNTESLKQNKDKRAAAQTLRTNADIFAFQALVHAEQDPTLPTGVHDILNTDFIEALAIDGFHQSAAVVQSQNQTLAQFIYGHCNEIVNELIFDLRPVSEQGGLTIGPYSREPDELGVNKSGTEQFPATIGAVKYEPAVIFREYPYSVVESIDLSNLHIAPGNPGEGPVDAGTVYMGPVFALNPNSPGRHVYTYKTQLAPQPAQYLAGQPARKHIDAVVIRNTDVVTAALGRSDEDVFNIYQMYAQTPISIISMRDQLSNFCPIVNQISVARHGLRVRELTTDFANYDSAHAKEFRFARRNLIRWQILMDHWYQHNAEYLTGSISLRGMPEIRAGYRLDWLDRSESYYVETVTHQWSYPGALTTTVEVSRGQRNDPFPAYIPPVFLDAGGKTLQTSSGNRSKDGRLAQYFRVKDRRATVTAVNRGDPTTDTGPNTTDQIASLSATGGRAITAFVEQQDSTGRPENRSTDLQPIPSASLPEDVT
jgi:hypothetical protein